MYDGFIGAKKDTAAGLALTAPLRLREAVSSVCGVRKRSPGAVTTYLRAQHACDEDLGAVHRKRSKHDKLDKSAR
jgi:hypothetical protein